MSSPGMVSVMNAVLDQVLKMIKPRTGHLPMVSGTHDIEIVCWRPFGTWYERLSSKFIGGYPRLIQDRLACFDGSLGKDQFITLF